MAGPIEHIRQTLVDRIRQIIDDHRADGRAADAGLTCSCGAKGLTDHPLHVAEQIVDGLGPQAPQYRRSQEANSVCDRVA
jgi:hypothetical protein